jgi:hypothetical protein
LFSCLPALFSNFINAQLVSAMAPTPTIIAIQFMNKAARIIASTGKKEKQGSISLSLLHALRYLQLRHSSRKLLNPPFNLLPLLVMSQQRPIVLRSLENYAKPLKHKLITLFQRADLLKRYAEKLINLLNAQSIRSRLYSAHYRRGQSEHCTAKSTDGSIVWTKEYIPKGLDSLNHCRAVSYNYRIQGKLL